MTLGLAARSLLTVAIVAITSSAVTAPVWAADWNPRAYANENTVQLGVVREDGQPHWFKVWVVVIDDQAYVRLGARSAAKIEANKNKPYLGVRVAGQEFDRIKGEPAPETAARVGQAMAEKYWSDFVVRLVDHPLILRLLRE